MEEQYIFHIFDIDIIYTILQHILSICFLKNLFLEFILKYNEWNHCQANKNTNILVFIS